MLRNSKKIPIVFLEQYLDNFAELKGCNVELRIDSKNAKNIIDFLTEKDKEGKLIHKRRFQLILDTVLKGRYNNDLYGYELKEKNVTAMKFKGKLNFRIACKEIKCDNKTIVMVTNFHKKSTKGKKNSKKDLQIYNAVGEYEYDC